MDLGFRGGTLTTSKNGEVVVILRDGDKIVSKGQFFGPDAVNVAGQILATAGGGDNSINAMLLRCEGLIKHHHKIKDGLSAVSST